MTFHEYFPTDKNLEKTLLELGDKWQKAIKGPHVHLGHLNFFENYIGKRWFYTKDGEQITSMVMLSRLEAKKGWFLKFLAVLPNVCHETSEFAMISLFQVLQKENCQFLTKGMMPLDDLGEIKGFGDSAKNVLKGIYKLLSMIFRFKKRREYWQRYSPQCVPAYLVFTNSKIGLNEIRALIKVFKTNL